MDFRSYTLLDFYRAQEDFLINAVKQYFENEFWVKNFLRDSHHGFKHGNQVRECCLELVDRLTPDENRYLLNEGGSIDMQNPLKSAIAAIEIAALFHDCGRFNDSGEVVADEQINHHLASARRAAGFCTKLGTMTVNYYVHDAIISHDFQSRKLTPYLHPPRTMIGKIVQASDQMRWFNPDSVDGTVECDILLALKGCSLRSQLFLPSAKKARLLTSYNFILLLSKQFHDVGLDFLHIR